MIFDTHSHYNLEPLWPTWADHWAKAQAKGVTKSLVVGVTVETSQRAADLAAQNPHFKASVAIHPSEYQYLIENLQPSAAEIESLIATQITELKHLAKDQNVVAIGETGLDYYRLPADPQLASAIKAAQLQAFQAHLALATETNLPVVIHVRDTGTYAYQDVLTALKAATPLPQPFILHCVSGPQDYLKAAIELGGYIGIAGNVTYKNAEAIRNLVRATPTDRLLLETDAPFLPPQEFRGQVCEPWMIALTGEYVQDELNLNLEQLYRNAETLFKF